MSRIQYTAPIEEIIGKLAGSVFQDSYAGFQVRSRTSPRNPQTTFQQLRRGMFGFITESWRNLSPTEKNSFIVNAPPGITAFNFYVSCSINVTLVNQPLFSTFYPSTTTDIIDMQIDELTMSSFLVSASSLITTVPADHSLLFFSTVAKANTKIFTNPSQYQPILKFVAGTDLSISREILTDYVDHYGMYLLDQRLCIKSALINNTNGLRTDGAISCAIIAIPPTYYIIDFDGAILIDADGTHITSQ